MLSYAMLSKQGNRDYNEDCIWAETRENEACFVLADGLGGQGNGSAASTYVVDKVKKQFNHYKNEKNKEFIDCVIQDCQNELLELKKSEESTTDMMTTMVLLVINQKNITWGHVGDSRLYFFENDLLIERTIDHSVPQILASSGEIEEKEIRHHPDRNRLLRAIGVQKSGKLNSIQERDCEKKKYSFLLCSDGFWELINEDEMEQLLCESKTPQQWLEKMEKTVLKNGRNTNMDNYSAICVFLDNTLEDAL